jgi:predicted nuclease of predicted toxin-antitoxin system
MLNNALRIALLIDGDNAQPALIEPILEKLTEYGTCVIRRVYGDLTAQNMSSSWRMLEQKHGIQLVHQSSYVAGKNSTDMALTIAAMDILHSGKVSAFCIVSSDSDFTPLVVRLKDEGVTVIGVGKATTPQVFMNACSFFIATDTLRTSLQPVTSTQAKLPSLITTIPQPKPTVAPINIPKPKKVLVTASQPKPNATQSPLKAIPDARFLLQQAYEISTHQDGWVLLSALGDSLRKIDNKFKSKTYGQKGLTQLVSQHHDLFEIRKKGNGVAQRMHVKLKKK